MIVYDIQQLTKRYPGQKNPANDQITLQIVQGEIYGILGDNGAGKSTLVKQMANLLAHSSGTIALFGKPIGYDPLYVPLTVGYMPQESAALNNLTVQEALYFTAHLRGLSRSDARQERERLIEAWQLGPLRTQPSSRLSGGQRRLLRLAVAVAGQPPVLILDEPTNDLDPQKRRLVWERLRQINQQLGTTIIFITHDAIEAEKIIQRVGILHNGRLVASGSPSQLKQPLGQSVRLELFTDPMTTLQLPEGFYPKEVGPGHWVVRLEKTAVGELLSRLEMSQIDDFRLTSTTLEDLYLHYATQA